MVSFHSSWEDVIRHRGSAAQTISASSSTQQACTRLTHQWFETSVSRQSWSIKALQHVAFGFAWGTLVLISVCCWITGLACALARVFGWVDSGAWLCCGCFDTFTMLPLLQQHVGSNCFSYKSLSPLGQALGLCGGVWPAAAALYHFEHWSIFTCCSDSLVFLLLARHSLVLSQESVSAKVTQVIFPLTGNFSHPTQ